MHGRVPPVSLTEDNYYMHSQILQSVYSFSTCDYTHKVNTPAYMLCMQTRHEKILLAVWWVIGWQSIRETTNLCTIRNGSATVHKYNYDSTAYHTLSDLSPVP